MADIPHPEEPPVWLDKWLSEYEISSRFSEAIPGMAFRAFMHSENLAISFTPRCLHATIDNQHARWRFDDVRGWECECSCKSPVPCIHAYMATIMFRNVCKEEGWPLPTGGKRNAASAKTTVVAPKAAPSAPVKPPAEPKNTTAAPVPPPKKPPVERQLSFFGDGNTRPVEESVVRKVVHHCTLECRVDCTSSNSSFILMFRTQENGIGADRLLSWVRECAYELEKGLKSLYEWDESDAKFLRWILAYLRKVPFERLNGYRWFVPFGDFAVWLQRYPEMTRRMIDNRNAVPLGKVMPFYPQEIFLRLKSVLAGVRVECFFKDSTGNTMKYHEMRNMEQEDRSGFIASYFKNIFRWPADKMRFLKFVNGSVTMNMQNVCDFLKTMLDGHYELIEQGELVVRERLERTPVSVEASSDGWTFRVVCRDSLKSAGTPSAISLKGGLFHIAVYDQFKESIDDIRKSVESLHALAEDFRSRTRGYYRDGVYSCRALPENVMPLRKLWNQIPPKIKKNVGDGMEGILGNPESLKMDIVLKAQGSFVGTSARCSCHGETIALEELATAARNNSPLVKSLKGSWFFINADEMADAMQTLNDYGLMSGESIMFPDTAAKMLKSLGNKINVEDNSVAFANRLAKQTFPAVPKLPTHFDNVLRPYQKFGFNFLAERCRYGVGTILADDMGLGKTVQLLALLEACKANSTKRFRAIVVSPATVVDVWLQQAAQFAPLLKVVAMRGNSTQRKQVLQKDDYDILVTHYGLVRSDIDALSSCDFDYVVLDEAQAIKNPEAQISQAVRGLKAECRLAMTGTPLENRLRDLWSIMDFINPGFWGTWGDFETKYDNTGGYAKMRSQLRMLMLRRKKEAVDLELPPKTVEVVSIDMDDAARKRYNTALLRARGMADSGDRISILAALTKLRMFCCAPELVDGTDGLEAAKLDYMMEKISELIENGHSILVFSQFTSMLDIVERRLDEAAVSHFKITGETPVTKRGSIVDAFNESATPSVFLLSLKAAGTGLTLTKADYVFMYDPWWNPAAENQAIDRTHRIGQDKPVFAYRLVLKSTVEEKVMQIVESKRKLFNEVIDESGASGGDSRLSIEELRSLLD